MNKLSIEKVKNDTKLSNSVIHYIEKVSQIFLVQAYGKPETQNGLVSILVSSLKFMSNRRLLHGNRKDEF